MSQPPCDPKLASLGSARLIPLVLLGVGGYATYVVVKVLCVDVLLRHGPMRDHGAAIAILIVYFLLLVALLSTYLRLLVTMLGDPGYVPRGPASVQRADEEKTRRPTRRRAQRHDAVELSQPYPRTAPDANPDSPGLELFYTKDIFVCEKDGRPRWCSECATWKPDRTHHCSNVGRCVRKMDHFCPWVGGVVGETNFKFFIQFVSYTTVGCAFMVIIMGYYIKQLSQHGLSIIQLAIVLGLAGLFGLFTFGMSMTVFRFVLLNITSVENLNRKNRVYDFAVFIPSTAELAHVQSPQPAPSYRTVTYPLPYYTSRISPSNDTSTVTIPSHETLSERDRKATRTFAILSTEPGDNPWDLGAPLQNFKTVMGDRLVDWLLPTRRSPCCNHEDTRSQFTLGPAIDVMLAKHGLVHPSTVRNVVAYNGNLK